MEPEGSLPHSQVPATCPYPVPAQSSPYPLHLTSWRSILILSFHLYLGLRSCLFPSSFPTKTLYTPLLSPPYMLHVPAHLILDLIARIIFGEECGSLSFSLCNFLQSPVGRNRKYSSGSSRQAVDTDSFKNTFQKEETDSKWRLCKQYEETIDRLTSLRMAQFGEVWVGNETRQSWCTAAVLDIQSTGQGADRHSGTHTHTHTRWTWRCDSVVEWRGTERERPDIIRNKKQKRENTHTARCGNTSRLECHAKGNRK